MICDKCSNPIGLNNTCPKCDNTLCLNCCKGGEPIAEKVEYYITCGPCDDNDIETVLEGVGEYYRDGNTLYALPCPQCGHEAEIQGWFDECEECGELHYQDDPCDVADDLFNLK